MKVKFTKMSGCGNDFVVIDHRNGFLHGKNLVKFAKSVCHRKTGVGADWLILIENSDKHAFKWKFFNSDGSIPEMCGNGARCAARFAFENQISLDRFVFDTAIGPIEAEVKGERVKVQMFEPKDLHLDFKIKLRNRDVLVSYVDSGVPHIVLEGEALKDRASLIRHHPDFPRGANVDFVTYVDRSHLKIITFERGVEDFTLACGTGAVASAIVYAEKDLIETPVHVEMPGGIVDVSWKDHYKKVYLEGPVDIVFEGEWLWKES